MLRRGKWSIRRLWRISQPLKSVPLHRRRRHQVRSAPPPLCQGRASLVHNLFPSQRSFRHYRSTLCGRQRNTYSPPGSPRGSRESRQQPRRPLPRPYPVPPPKRDGRPRRATWVRPICGLSPDARPFDGPRPPRRRIFARVPGGFGASRGGFLFPRRQRHGCGADPVLDRAKLTPRRRRRTRDKPARPAPSPTSHCHAKHNTVLRASPVHPPHRSSRAQPTARTFRPKQSFARKASRS
jgi:hypothetical protein